MTYYRLKTNSFHSSFILTTTDYCYVPSTKPPLNPLLPPPPPIPRSLSLLGTDDYSRSLRRSFSRAKLLAFFNPDLTQFITLTYKSSTHTHQQVISDIKHLIKKQNTIIKNNNMKIKIEKKRTSIAPAPPQWEQPSALDDQANEVSMSSKAIGSSREPATRLSGLDVSPSAWQRHLDTSKRWEPPLDPAGNVVIDQRLLTSSATSSSSGDKGDLLCERNPLKYIYVMEYQKRGSIHVHMIASEGFQTYINHNGHRSIQGWTQGFSSVLTIKDFDNNFKPYLYLFKYMAKAQRIGSSFIHTSKNFDKIETVDYAHYINRLKEENIYYQEDYQFKLDQRTCNISKKYFRGQTT